MTSLDSPSIQANGASFFFFLNVPAPPEISPLPLPDALPIWSMTAPEPRRPRMRIATAIRAADFDTSYEGTPPWEIGRPQPALLAVAEEGRVTGRVLDVGRSEEHTSELQSPCNLVCRLLLEKK